MNVLHRDSPEVFHGWADQRAEAFLAGGRSRAEGANGALGGILACCYGAEVGDPARWGSTVDAWFKSRTGRAFLPHDQVAALFVAALVDYLATASED